MRASAWKGTAPKSHAMADPAKHTLIEAAQGIVSGATLAAFGIVVLTDLCLVTGQTAGLAVLISFITGWAFGPISFVINLPFCLLGFLGMGWQFTQKTFVAVALLSALGLGLPKQVSFASLNPWVGAAPVRFSLWFGAAGAVSSRGQP